MDSAFSVIKQHSGSKEGSKEKQKRRLKRKRAGGDSIKENAASDQKSVTGSPVSDSDSIVEAKALPSYMILPESLDNFFDNYWEKKALLIERSDEDHNTGWFSTSELNSILKTNHLNFTENIDLTSYEDGERITHNPTGRAFATVVWEHFQRGCSVRFLNPQTFCENVWHKLSLLQDYFGCLVGANTYLTPANTQGFAPHWDDIEAFVLQLEGKKHWRIYEPSGFAEMLPLESSPNFNDEDLVGRTPVIDVILKPGDLLYFPRGFIHQADTLGMDKHSLHITVSTFQKNSWGNFIEKLVNIAVKRRMNDSFNFRRGLPVEYLRYMGHFESKKRFATYHKYFSDMVTSLVDNLVTGDDVHAACDVMAQNFLYDSLPPYLPPAQRELTAGGSKVGPAWDTKTSSLSKEPSTDALSLSSEVRLVRASSVRLALDLETELENGSTSEESQVVLLYYNTANERLYHATDLQCVEVEKEVIPAVLKLKSQYPEYLPVSKLPLTSDESKMSLLSALFVRGLLMVKEVI